MTSWRKVKLGKVAEINPGGNLIPNKFVYIDLGSVVSGRLVKNSIIYRDKAPSRAQRLLSSGDVIFQIVRPYQRNNFLFNGDTDLPVVASTGYAQIRYKECPLFIYYALHLDGFVDAVLSKCTGSNYPAVTSSDLAEIYINMPTINEQLAIVEVIRDFDDYLDKVRAKLEATRQLKKGLSQQIFSGQIRFKDDDGRDFPDWESWRLGEVSDVYQPVTISKDIIKEGDYSVYGANGIIGKYTDYNHEYEQITIACRGTCGIVNFTKPKSWITGNSMIINLDNNRNIIKKFMYYELTSQNLKYLIGGSGIPQIIGSDLKKHKIYIPSLPEQQKIANFLSNIDELINSLEELLESAKLQKKWLLDNLVTGKIRLKEFRDE